MPVYSLVVGADGVIGRALASRLTLDGAPPLVTTRRAETVTDTRLYLDLADDLSGWLPPAGISVAYLCAAVSSQERCRAEPHHTAMVNVHNTVRLARKLSEAGAFVIFPSTSLVFDGSVPFRKANDATCPLTEYGRQKALAEALLRDRDGLFAVVRFTKVLWPDVPLLRGWARSLTKGEPVHPLSDMVMAPLSVDFAVEVLACVAENRTPGIIQVSGPTDISYDQVARHIAIGIGASQDLVQPVTSGQAGINIEAVPPNTTLDTTRLHQEYDKSPPDVWSTIDSVLDL